LQGALAKFEHAAGQTVGILCRHAHSGNDYPIYHL